MPAQTTNAQHLVQNDLTAREEKVASKTYRKFIAALAIGFVLLMAFFAAAGTKMIDITALHFKGQGVTQQQPEPGRQEKVEPQASK